MNWTSIWNTAFGVVAGVFAALYGQPRVHGNNDAVDVIVTVFSVLAGFLVAIVIILGDTTTLLPGGVRVATKQRRVIRRNLNRKHALFYTYLITLGLIFVSKLLADTDEMLPWVERIYLFLATLGFVLSFRLPSALRSVQERRLEIAIEERKNVAG